MTPFADVLRWGSIMACRQLGLAETLVDSRLGINARLQAIEAAIDWGPVERQAETVHAGETGRPPYPARSMIRALYLQMLYGRSDPALEEALTDRLPGQWFCDFGMDQGTPDTSTIWRFRTQAAQGVMSAGFADVVRQLDAQGLILRQGTLIDATLIDAASLKPSMTAGRGAKREREPGAAWTRKHGRSDFGYRLHVGTDKAHNIIRTVVFTPANLGETTVADALICGDEAAVYGGKGYESKHRRLKARGAKDRICHRSHKNQKGRLFWHTKRNKAIAKRRAQIEPVVGTGKRGFG